VSGDRILLLGKKTLEMTGVRNVRGTVSASKTERCSEIVLISNRSSTMQIDMRVQESQKPIYRVEADRWMKLQGSRGRNCSA
jgi:hypothetical protein